MIFQTGRLCCSSSDAVRACSILKHEVKQLGSSQSREPEEVQQGSFLWSTFDSESSPRRSSKSPEDQLKDWYNDGLMPRSMDPLVYWNNHTNGIRFPLLKKLAIKYLPSQATSVPSERVFSSAGRIISDLRSRLTDENSEMLIFLHHNLQNATQQPSSAHSVSFDANEEF